MRTSSKKKGVGSHGQGSCEHRRTLAVCEGLYARVSFRCFIHANNLVDRTNRTEQSVLAVDIFRTTSSTASATNQLNCETCTSQQNLVCAHTQVSCAATVTVESYNNMPRFGSAASSVFCVWALTLPPLPPSSVDTTTCFFLRAPFPLSPFPRRPCCLC